MTGIRECWQPVCWIYQLCWHKTGYPVSGKADISLYNFAAASILFHAYHFFAFKVNKGRLCLNSIAAASSPVTSAPQPVIIAQPLACRKKTWRWCANASERTDSAPASVDWQPSWWRWKVNLLPEFVRFARKYARHAVMSVPDMSTITVRNALKRVTAVLKNAGKCQPDI